MQVSQKFTDKPCKCQKLHSNGDNHIQNYIWGGISKVIWLEIMFYDISYHITDDIPPQVNI